MIYRQFQDLKLSALGFGTMRLPIKNEVYADIDMAAAEEMLDYAMSRGVNYYDTAWGYHDGKSEIAVGKILGKYPRNSYYLASKFPGYDLSNMGKTEEIFESQLKKCGVEYFDFYLFHNVCEMNIDAYLDDEKYGTFSYLINQKRKGRIKHLGLSVHGSLEVLKRFLDAYGADMEFCQVQLNYFDYKFQKAEDKIKLLSELKIPVIVMEPLRGGKLAKLAAEDEKTLLGFRPDEGIPAWAFRYLQSFPEVAVTLSGMSDFSQVKENIRTYETDAPLTEAEMAALSAIADKMITSTSLPCTACRYCTSHCPVQLDIPEIIRLYNEHKSTQNGFIAPMYVSTLPEEKRPSACLNCKSCEKVCPQNIAISDMMKKFNEMLKN